MQVNKKHFFNPLTVLACSYMIFLSCFNIYAQKDIFDVSRTGTVEEIKKLYDEYPDVINSKNEMGYDPLVLACYNGNKDVVAFLVDKVLTINGSYKHGSPLMAATIKGYSEIVSILLNAGADPNTTDETNTTAAHYAIMYKNYDIIEQLLKVKTDFDIKNNIGKSPMDYVYSFNDKKLDELFKNE